MIFVLKISCFFCTETDYKILSGNEEDTLNNRETHCSKSDLFLMFHLKSASFYSAKKDFFHRKGIDFRGVELLNVFFQNLAILLLVHSDSTAFCT